MSSNEVDNFDYIECWNSILVPKWNRFRHLLSGNGAIHSDIALPRFGLRPGDRVLDIGCGYGETCLDIARLVGPQGEVHGVDCTEAFLEEARRECEQAGMSNVRYELGDAQHCALPHAYYDAAFSRFGVMFFQSVVAALRNVHTALKPGGRVCLIVWRRIQDNPCWGKAKEVALEFLPPPGDGASTCGPGPFSMAGEDTDRAMLKAAGFTQVDLFERIDADICIGRDMQEAIDYQILVGPSGEIIREAGEEGARRLPEIRARMAEVFRPYERPDGVFMPSSTWAIAARKSA